MNVFCVGLTTKDSIFYLKAFPRGEGKHLARDFLTCGGGPAATAAAALTRLGTKASVWSRVGDDLIATDIITELRQYGVNTKAIERVSGCYSTNATVVIDEAGERFIVSYSDPQLYKRDVSLNETQQAFIQRHDCVLVDTRWTGAALAALQFARRAGIPTVLDGEVSVDHAVRELAPLAEHAVLSYKGLLDLLELPDDTQLSDHDLGDALKLLEVRFNNRVYVTRGAAGAYCMEAGKLCNVPSYAVDVVDTLGAGDVFHGAFCHFLLKRYKAERILRYACAAAAMKCTAGGGRGCLPTMEMLERFLATAKPLV